MDAANGVDPAREAAGTARGLELAYRYLNHRERTTHELRRHLLGRDLDASAVEAVVGELTDLGYLDDARFARLFTQDKRELQGWGSGRIRSALLSSGVDPETVDVALAAPADGDAEGEFERAAELLARRFPDPPRERRDRQRAFGVLVRRGYEPELALDVIASYARGDGLAS